LKTSRHSRLSVNALCTYNNTFEEDVVEWTSLGIQQVGLIWRKMDPHRGSKIRILLDHGIRVSTVTAPPFDLGALDTWEGTREEIAAAIETAASTGAKSIYMTTGRSDGRPWRELLEAFTKAIAPSVTISQEKGIRLAVEPSLRTDRSFVHTLRDAVDLAEQCGVAIVVDFGNCWMERDYREIIFRLAPHIALVQICDIHIGSIRDPSLGGRKLPGEGELPLERMMKDVLDAGYSGLFELEVLGPSIESEGYHSVLERGVDLSSALLRKCGVGD
jgi:sugar phosphate isomerase/epimerase